MAGGRVANPPAGARARAGLADQGGPVVGVEGRIVDDDGKLQPRDGKAAGEIQVRGPWVTASYYKDEDPSRFAGGWLRTGDVGT